MISKCQSLRAASVQAIATTALAMPTPALADTGCPSSVWALGADPEG
jgi:hypothetical protein